MDVAVSSVVGLMLLHQHRDYDNSCPEHLSDWAGFITKKIIRLPQKLETSQHLDFRN